MMEPLRSPQRHAPVKSAAIGLSERKSQLLRRCEEHVRERREELVRTLRLRSPADLVARIIASESEAQRRRTDGDASMDSIKWTGATDFGSSGTAPEGEEGLSEAERIEFLLYLEEELYSELALVRQQDAYEALEREESAFAEELANFVADGTSALVEGGDGQVSSSSSSCSCAPPQESSSSEWLDEDGNSDRPHDYSVAVSRGGDAASRMVRNSDVLCPICRKLRLCVVANTTILCKCGFRMETSMGFSIDDLASSLSSCYALHRERCSAEPGFSFNAGVGCLMMTCSVCGELQVIV